MPLNEGSLPGAKLRNCWPVRCCRSLKARHPLSAPKDADGPAADPWALPRRFTRHTSHSVPPSAPMSDRSQRYPAPPSRSPAMPGGRAAAGMLS